MAAHTFRWRFVFILILLSGIFLLASFDATRAQSLNEGFDALSAKYNKHRKLIPRLMKGTETTNPSDKTHLEALDVNARYHTYRVFLDHLETPNPKKQNNTIDRAFTEFEYDLKYLKDGKPNTQAAIDIFRDKVRVHALEVIQFPDAARVHKIHNARILAEIAKLGQPELAETLITVLKDEKQTDGVRYYALRGFRNLLALAQPGQMPPLLKKEQETQCAEALVEFLEQKQGPPKGAAQDEIDGFCLLRREAIRALAQIHTPAVSEKVRPALVLARFAGADGRIQPPPRIDERMEASLGLARMQSAQEKQYQADYAACQIGRCLGAFGQKVNEEKGKEGERTRPWKIDAHHLNEALAALKGVSGKDPYVAKVVERGTRLLDEVMKGEQANTNDVTWFTTPQGDPPNKELFKGAADSVVKPAQPAEAPVEK
jgi:hypothetical protein